MKLLILAIGKKHDPKLASALSDYSKRLAHYATIEWRLLEAKITTSMTQQEICEVESKLLVSQLTETDFVVLLDERGTQFDSTRFAQMLQQSRNRSIKRMVFVIGGAYGVNSELTHRANVIWSLSKLVLPHQLVRLILIEQIYRVHTILAGEKYHHA